MSPVATTPWRRRSLGTANPVQPTSSSTCQPRRDAGQRMAALFSAVNIGEVSESAKRTAAASTGAGSSAATYQRAPTRHRSSREQFAETLRSREEDGQQDARDRGSCQHRRGDERQERVELAPGARKAAWTDHQDEAARLRM